MKLIAYSLSVLAVLCALLSGCYLFFTKEPFATIGLAALAASMAHVSRELIRYGKTS